MNYYKLINGTTFVGIATSQDLRRFQTKHSIILVCSEEQAQYVQVGDIFYRDNWLLPTITDKVEYQDVSIIQITEEEYNTLYEAIDSGEEIDISDDNEEPVQLEVPEVDPIEEITIEFLKERKTQEMSATCNAIIVAGFDVILSDNETHHFSLTVQDQLNLITLSSMAAAGEAYIPYHADGELCRMFTADDINKMVVAATEFKTFHTTYFNSLKVYINSMDSIDKVASVEYGVSIPEEYQSDVLKILLAHNED